MVIKVILYFVDDLLELIYQDRIITCSFKEAVFQGKIINREKFMEMFLQVLKKEKIKNKLFHNQVTIVKQDFYSGGDLFFFESIFEELGFIKINYIELKSLLDTDSTYIEINQSYMIIHLKEDIWIDLKFFSDIPFLIRYFKEKMIGDIVLFGKNKLIPSIQVSSFFIYYFDRYSHYIADVLLKQKGL